MIAAHMPRDTADNTIDGEKMKFAFACFAVRPRPLINGGVILYIKSRYASRMHIGFLFVI